MASNASDAAITVAFSGCISIGMGIFSSIDEFNPVAVVPTSKNGSFRLIEDGTLASSIAVSTNSKTLLLLMALL